MPSLYDRLQEEIDRRAPQAGLDPADLLDLPDDTRRLVQRLARRGDASAAELADDVGLSEAEAAQLLTDLIGKGLVASSGEPGAERYRVAFGQRQTREVPLDIWSALSERLEE